MTAQKTKDSASPQSSTTTTPSAAGSSGRKPWKKRSATDIILAQLDRLRDDVTKKEQELNVAKRQLEKLEGLRKALETP